MGDILARFSCVVFRVDFLFWLEGLRISTIFLMFSDLHPASAVFPEQIFVLCE